MEQPLYITVGRYPFTAANNCIHGLRATRYRRIVVEFMASYEGCHKVKEVFETIAATQLDGECEVDLKLHMDLEDWFHCSTFILSNKLLLHWVKELRVNMFTIEREEIAIDWSHDHSITMDMYNQLADEQEPRIGRMFSVLLDTYPCRCSFNMHYMKTMEQINKVLEYVTPPTSPRVFYIRFYGVTSASPVRYVENDYEPFIKHVERIKPNGILLQRLPVDREAFEKCIRTSLILTNQIWFESGGCQNGLVNTHLKEKQKIFALAAGKEIKRLTMNSTYTQLPMDVLRLVKDCLYVE